MGVAGYNSCITFVPRPAPLAKDRLPMELYVPLLVVLLLLSAFFSSSETAFLSLQRMQLEHAVRSGRVGAGRVSKLVEHPGRLVASILVGNNLANTATAAVGTVIAAELVSGGGSVLVATAVVTVLLVIFGEVVPKTAALHFSYPMASAYSIPLRAWVAATRPVIVSLDQLTKFMLRITGASTEEQGAFTLGELRTAIVVGRESGTIQEEQSEMLLGALGLHDVQARRLMVARVDIEAVEATDTVRHTGERLSASGFQRVPVFGETIDDIIGYVHVSDVCRAMVRNQDHMPVASIIRPALFEPQNAPASRVLERMQESNSHMVILIDEYGSTAGLVTLEDLLEEVVGEIRSESGAEAATIEARPTGRTVVDGRMRLSELGEQLDREFDYPNAETVAGLLLEQLGKIPFRGEYTDYLGFRFTVVSADRRRVRLIAVEPTPAELEAMKADIAT